VPSGPVIFFSCARTSSAETDILAPCCLFT
jgi:hypothetical protein